MLKIYIFLLLPPPAFFSSSNGIFFVLLVPPVSQYQWPQVSFQTFFCGNPLLHRSRGAITSMQLRLYLPIKYRAMVCTPQICRTYLSLDACHWTSCLRAKARTHSLAAATPNSACRPCFARSSAWRREWSVTACDVLFEYGGRVYGSALPQLQCPKRMEKETQI